MATHSFEHKLPNTISHSSPVAETRRVDDQRCIRRSGISTAVILSWSAIRPELNLKHCQTQPCVRPHQRMNSSRSRRSRTSQRAVSVKPRRRWVIFARFLTPTSAVCLRGAESGKVSRPRFIATTAIHVVCSGQVLNAELFRRPQTVWRSPDATPFPPFGAAPTDSVCWRKKISRKINPPATCLNGDGSLRRRDSRERDEFIRCEANTRLSLNNVSSSALV